jgi:hypothetical protein
MLVWVVLHCVWALELPVGPLPKSGGAGRGGGKKESATASRQHKKRRNERSKSNSQLRYVTPEEEATAAAEARLRNDVQESAGRTSTEVCCAQYKLRIMPFATKNGMRREPLPTTTKLERWMMLE